MGPWDAVILLGFFAMLGFIVWQGTRNEQANESDDDTD